MNEIFSSILDTDDIRQGDIIRKVNRQFSSDATYGVVLTADCDIAQKKAGERYTWLEIISMKSYVQGVWAEDQLRKISERRSKPLCEMLNSQIRRIDINLTALTQDSLSKWLSTSSADEILTSICGQKPSAESQMLRDLKAFALATIAEGSQTPFSRLKALWELTGKDEKKQREAVRDAFKEGGGFQDFFVLPELPKTPGVGFVVLLRSMSTVMASDLFLTEQDARIHDRPSAFHRIGRLSDGVRFAITQKLAFLFSRIGMPKSFESACETATEVTLEEIYDIKINKDRK